MASNPYILLAGPVLLGGLISYFLHGVFALQLYHYYINYAATDRKFFVYLVCTVTVIEVLHLAFCTHTVYGMLVEGYMDPTVFINTPWSGAALPAINAAGGFCTQVFLAWRIQALTRSILGKIAAGVIALIATAQLGSGLAITIQYSTIQNIELLVRLTTNLIAWLVIMFTCDILISISMVAVLVTARRGTSYAASKNMLNALIVHTVENGLVTTLCALASLLSYLLYPQYFFYICFEFLLGRLFANVLMATLNGRDRIRSAATSDYGFTDRSGGAVSSNAVGLTNIRTFRGTGGTNSKAEYPAAVVSVTTDVQIDHDDDLSMSKSRAYPA